MENDRYSLIRRYYRNELSLAERSEFENRLKEDAAFAAEAREEALLYEGIQAAGDAAWEEEMQAMGRSLMARHKRQVRFRSLRPLALAAAAVLLLLISFPLWPLGSQAEDPQTLAREYFEPLPAPTGRGTDEPTATNDPYLAYQRGDYENALIGFQQLEADQQDAESWLYRGLSHLSLGDAQAALNALEQVQVGQVAYDDASWYRALALLSLDRPKDARKLLKAISQRSRTEWKAEAQELLERL
jgi:tetratricopeptide (TPR) repeat protein